MSEKSLDIVITEKVDWFKLIYGVSQLNVAKRIKATTTEMLLFLSKDKVPSSDSKSPRYLAHYFAKKELKYRLDNNNINTDGDPKYKNKFHGYEKLTWPPSGIKEDILGLNPYKTYMENKSYEESTLMEKVDFLRFIKENRERLGLSCSLIGGSVMKVNLDEHSFNVPLLKRNVVVPNAIINEVLTPAQRMKRKQTLRRLAPRLALARKKAMKRRAGTEVLKKRAKLAAKKVFIKKALGGKNKADVSAGEKARVEKLLLKKKAAVERLATKLLPMVRKKQADRFSKKSDKSDK